MVDRFVLFCSTDLNSLSDREYLDARAGRPTQAYDNRRD